jgi:DNA-binding response OmpR family regulator
MSERAGPGPHILLVEDDPDQVFLLSAFLESQGYTVDAVTETRKGLQKYQANDYFCAIIDVMMPDGGAEYILRNAPISHPIIVLTAAREDRKKDFLDLGAYAFCSKQDISRNLNPILGKLAGKLS